MEASVNTAPRLGHAESANAVMIIATAKVAMDQLYSSTQGFLRQWLRCVK